MFRNFACIATLLLVGVQPTVADRSDAAVAKVIQMLTDMLAKGQAALHSEQVEYSKFSVWCTSEKASLQKSIAGAGEQIEGLSATIGELGVQVSALTKEIAELNAQLESDEADMAATKAQREKDNAAFLAEQTDYSESISALERAITVLGKQNYDRPALLQLSESASLPQNVKNVLAAFVGMTSDDSSQAPPEANAYEFQSGGIVSMLKKLLSEFSAKKEEIEKEEMNSVHAANMVVQDLTDSIAVAKKTISEKSVLKQSKLASSAEAKKELAQVETTKKEDEATLKDLTTECTEKDYSYEEKQVTRKEELQALEKAIEILDSEEARGGDYLLGLTQKNKGKALVQLSSSTESEGIHRRVREFLRAQAERLHSKNLNLLAERISADPFGKVKTMIDEMITKLEQEAFADAEHEGFCDTEMGKSKITRAKLTETIDLLGASIEKGKADASRMAQEIATLTKEVSELDASMSAAAKLRKEEKDKNKQEVEDATAAKTATEAAMEVLKDFYSKASISTAFLQVSSKKASAIPVGSEEWDSLANPNFKGTVDTGHKAGMQTFGETFTGQQASAGGVLAMMEVIISDFANIILDSTSAEAEAAKAFKDFMAVSKKNKETKLKSIEMTTADKITVEGKVQSDTEDLKSTQDQLLAANRYYERLVPQCIDQGMTFKERTAARQEEIQSLKEALKLLS